MSNKTTKKDLFNEILNGYELTAEHKDFILHELELLAKRSERKSTKPTKKQEANEALCAVIADLLADGTPRTATDVMKAVDGIESAQKASALLKKLVDSGMAEKFADKRITYFKAKSE